MASNLISSALYDATKATVFSKRNIDKTANGDIGRAAVAAGQIRNAVGAVAKLDNKVGKAASKLTIAFDKSANSVSFKDCESFKKIFDSLKSSKSASFKAPINKLNPQEFANLAQANKSSITDAIKILDKSTKGSKLWGYTAKGVNLASKAVNPLICVSAGIKVARSEDKSSEAINQTYALTSMFGAERTAKLFLTPEGREKLVKFGFGDKGISKKLMDTMARLDNMSNAAGASKYAKFGIPIIKGLGFVAASISGYALGSFIAGKINDSLKRQQLDCKA